MKKIIGIDIGGTVIKADLYDENGTCFNDYRELNTDIDYELKTNKILEQVCEIIDYYTKKYVVYGVGISSAGVVNSDSGEIVYSGYTIPAYTGVNFKEHILNKYNLPLEIENDVNCAAIAETWLGLAKGAMNVTMLTIGTGIGGSVIINGELLNGYNFTAGEVGYLPIDGKDWQTLASASALIKLYESRSGKVNQTGKTFFKDVDEKDVCALETLDIFIDRLAKGILTLSYILNPEILILGGGILNKKEIILPKLKMILEEKAMDSRFLPKDILAAKLGNAAGRIGAVKNFLNKNE